MPFLLVIKLIILFYHTIKTFYRKAIRLFYKNIPAEDAKRQRQKFKAVPFISVKSMQRIQCCQKY